MPGRSGQRSLPARCQACGRHVAGNLQIPIRDSGSEKAGLTGTKGPIGQIRRSGTKRHWCKVVTAGATHAQRVPLFDNLRLSGGKGDQQRCRYAVGPIFGAPFSNRTAWHPSRSRTRSRYQMPIVPISDSRLEQVGSKRRQQGPIETARGSASISSAVSGGSRRVSKRPPR